MELFRFDTFLRAGALVLCGVDEAGRGPLAGDVYAAAVVFDEGVVIEGINDSKKLSAKRREALYDEITAKAAAWCVASATVEEIEQLNILQATFLAMKRAVEGLARPVDLALVDGNRLPPLCCSAEGLIGGDGKSASIAAASILAKVSRDRYMLALSREYPQYCFDQHKGYGTALHRELIRQYGPCGIHRLSFLKNLMGAGV